MPALWRAVATDVCGPGNVAAVRELCRGGSGEPEGDILSAAPFVCEKCFLVQLGEYVTPDRDLFGIRLFFLLFRLMVEARPRIRGDDHATAWAGPEKPCDRTGEQ